MLNKSEQNDISLKRFKNKKIPENLLQEYLNRQGFQPTEVKDYGEIPDFYKYFAEFDTTVFFSIDPWLNDHHKSDGLHSITSISFNEKENNVFTQRIKLNKVNPILMDIIISGILVLINKSSKYRKKH